MEKEKDSKPSQEEEKVKETSQKKVQEIPVKEQNKEEKPVEPTGIAALEKQLKDVESKLHVIS